MSSYLIVTWDGAGNLVSTLGLAQRLTQRGHDVRLIGHRSIDARCGSLGWRFLPYATAPDFDSIAPRDTENELALIARDIMFNGAIADDVLAELEREPADALIVDAMLATALSVGAFAGIPTAALFHSPYSRYRSGPMPQMLAKGMPLVNDVRQRLNLPAADSLAELHDACALSILTTPQEFEPETSYPANVRFVGPIFDGPSLMTHVEPVDVPVGSDPSVVVSFSTSFQGQRAVTQLVMDALSELPVRVVVTTGPALSPAELAAPPNATVVRFAAHDRLLATASLVVTHAGLGTTMTALRHAVPLLCLPMGRDQFFNAHQVERLGAGRVLDPGTDRAAITATASELLSSSAVRDGAKAAAAMLARYRGADAAVDELERIVGR